MRFAEDDVATANEPVLRPYQDRAIDAVDRAWLTHKRVCLVAPTGSGKTLMASHLANAGALVLVHRNELVEQWRERVPHVVPMTVQGLLASGERPECPMVVLDECHHYRAADWQTVLDAYPDHHMLGLTATPQRGDGKALGDLFEALVVAAQYGELIDEGHLVRPVLYRPGEELRGLAQEPLAAYRQYADGQQCFAFAGSVADAARWAQEFTEAGVPSAWIEADTPAQERVAALEAFKAKRIRVLWNVYILTEGIDVPEASACLLARGCQHVGTYLQMVGRVLRPAPGKASAVVIDLAGVSHRHGLPAEGREYSLSGRGIGSSVKSVRDCPRCGCCHEPAPECPSCGYLYPVQARERPRIYNAQLAAVYSWEQTPDDAKASEWNRLMHFCESRGWSLGWALREYNKLFGEKPRWQASQDQKAVELRRLRSRASEKGYKPGWAAWQFKAIFGHWPPMGLR